MAGSEGSSSSNEAWGELSVLRGARRPNGIPLGGDRTFVYGFNKNKITFGRSTKSDVRISKDQCSRKHAFIERNGTEVILRDIALGGRMTVNGKKMTEFSVKLYDWTGFSICDRHFMVRIYGAPPDPAIEPYLPKLPEPSRESINTTASTVDTTVLSPDKSLRLSTASVGAAGGGPLSSGTDSFHRTHGKKRKLRKLQTEDGKAATKRRLYNPERSHEDSIFMVSAPADPPTSVFEGNSVLHVGDDEFSNSGWITNSADKIKLFDKNMAMNAEWDAMGAGEMDFEIGHAPGGGPLGGNVVEVQEETPSFIADTSSIVAAGTPPGINVTDSPCRSPVNLPNPDKQRSVLKSSLPNTLQRASTKSVRFRAFYQVAEIDAGSRSVTPAHHAVPPHLRQQQRPRFMGKYDFNADFNALLNEEGPRQSITPVASIPPGTAGILSDSATKSPGLSSSYLGLRLMATPDRVPVFPKKKIEAAPAETKPVLKRAESVKNHCNHEERLPPIVDAVDHLLRLPKTRANQALLMKLEKLNKGFLDLKQSVMKNEPEAAHREKILEAMLTIDLNAPDVQKLKKALCSISSKLDVAGMSGKLAQFKSPGRRCNLYEAIQRLQSGEAPDDFRNFVLRLLNAPAINMTVPELEWSPRTNRLRAIGDVDRMFKHMTEIARARKPSNTQNIDVSKEAPKRLRHALRRILEAPKAQKIIATLCTKLECKKQDLPEAAAKSLTTGLRALRAHPEWFSSLTPELRNMASSCILELMSTRSSNLPSLLLSSSRELNMYTPTSDIEPLESAIINGISNLMARNREVEGLVLDKGRDDDECGLTSSPQLVLPVAADLPEEGSKPKADNTSLESQPVATGAGGTEGKPEPTIKSPPKSCLKNDSRKKRKARLKSTPRNLCSDKVDKRHISFEVSKEDTSIQRRKRIRRAATPHFRGRKSSDVDLTDVCVGASVRDNTRMNASQGPVKITKFAKTPMKRRSLDDGKKMKLRKGTPRPDVRRQSDGWGNAQGTALKGLRENTDGNAIQEQVKGRKTVNTPHINKGLLNVSKATIDTSWPTSNVNCSLVWGEAAESVVEADLSLTVDRSFRMPNDGLLSMGSDGFAIPNSGTMSLRRKSTGSDAGEGGHVRPANLRRKSTGSDSVNKARQKKMPEKVLLTKELSIENIIKKIDKEQEQHWVSEIENAKPPFTEKWLRQKKVAELRKLCKTFKVSSVGRRKELWKALMSVKG